MGGIYDVPLSEWRTMPWWPARGTEAHVHAGIAGHEQELVVNIDGFGPMSADGREIPRPIVDVLAALLPETWRVDSRGTRIEVHPSGRLYGGWHEDDIAATLAALTDMGFNPEVRR